MSKSFKKNPIMGNTGDTSEKQDKNLANRMERRKAKEILYSCEDPDDLVIPDKRELFDEWEMNKDGKGIFDPNKYPEYMRK